MSKASRICAAVLALCVCCLIFAGCSNGTDPSSESSEPHLNTESLVVSVGETLYVTLENSIGAINDWHIATGEGYVQLVRTGNDSVGIYGASEGTAELHCEFVDGERTVSLTCSIIVVPGSFTLSPSSVVIIYGQSINLATFPLFSSEVVWESSDPTVAVVDESGKITGVGVGTASITASIAAKKEISASAVIYVSDAGSMVFGSLSVVPKNVETEVGSSVKLNASGGNGEYTWSSADPSIASVTDSGIVTALSAGTVKITCRDGSGSATDCSISIYRAPTSITVSPASAILSKGKTQTFTASVKPSDASKKINWYSSDPKVATVDPSGKVTMVGEGTATITAQSAYNSVKGTVTVSSGTKATGITVDKETVSVQPGDTFKITANVAPKDAAIRTYTVSISDKEIVAQNGNDITSFIALKTGTATITFKSNDGGFTAKTVVTVNQGITNAAINPASTQISVGKTAKLTVTAEPASAVEGGTWKSSDDTVATVDASGVVTAHKIGQATISYTFKNSNLTITANVVVNNNKSLNKTSFEIAVGQNETLSVEDAPDLPGTWKSSSDAVATVSAAGVVNAIKAGTATITFTPTDTSISAMTCTVTVYAATTGVTIAPDTVYMKSGDTQVVTATILPADAKQTGKWAVVSGGSVIDLDTSGKITAKASGVAKISFTTLDGIVKTVEVYVGERLTGITLGTSSTSVPNGGSVSLLVNFAPANAANTTGVWTSSDHSVATVSDKGVVTGVGAGHATVTFTANDGGFSASCAVTVTEDTEHTVSLYDGEIAIVDDTIFQMYVGTPVTLDVKTTPAAEATCSFELIGTDHGMTLTSSGSSVTVSASKSASAVLLVRVKVGSSYYTKRLNISALVKPAN